MANVLAVLYILIICLLAVYLYRMIGLSVHARMSKRQDSVLEDGEHLPFVTVQLPVYNEKAVINRLLDAACSLDYPVDRLQIQVLDDSTDITSDLISQKVLFWQQRGIAVEHVRRADHRGHKAGNLAHALPLAKGEFIAIFDADFVPQSLWLRHTIKYFLKPDNERLGLVQTRWSNMNAHDSLLTYAQDMAFHQFAIAQATRAHMGLWSSFYGSAGLWRKICIEEAGGWSADTFTEDLDMAYRAQLVGWRMEYDDGILASAELPPSMQAYKQQQFFWSKGNMQVVRILWLRLLAAPVSLLQRLDAILFSTWPVTHVLLLCRMIVQLLTLLWPVPWIRLLDLIAMLVLSVSFIPTVIDLLRGRLQIPLHLSLGIGMSVNVTAGLIKGLFGPMGEDFRATTPRSADAESRSGTTLDLIMLIELILAGLALLGSFIAFQQSRWWLILILLSDAQGYGWVAAQSVWETLKMNIRRVRVVQ